MVAGHPGVHGRHVAEFAVVDCRAKCAAVQILPHSGAEVGAMDIVAGTNLATQIVVQVRVCNQCYTNNLLSFWLLILLVPGAPCTINLIYIVF